MKEEYSREKLFKTFIKDIKKKESAGLPMQNTKTNKNKSLKKVLGIIYRDIYQAYVLNSNKDMRSDLTSLIQNPKNYSSTFFPKEIREYILANSQRQLIYTFAEPKIKIVFTLFSEEELAHLDNYTEQVKIMLLWLSICRMYSAKTCVNQIEIYIYPTPFNKKLPKTNIDILSADQINTAYTYHCPKNGEIVIFRNEEWFKVFLHETFHTYGLDFANVTKNNNAVDQRLRRLFPIDSEYNATEAYAETWARIMNCAINVFLALQNKKDENLFFEYMETSIELEREFSLFQCHKILNFMGVDYSDLYEETEKSRSLRKNLYKEKTNVFAYYVLTSIFMNDIGGFLHWCYTHNSSLLQFNNRSHQSLKEFADYIEEEYKNKTLTTCLIEMKEIYINASKKAQTRINVLLLETTRMSLFG
jgi:hypothetical protein